MATNGRKNSDLVAVALAAGKTVEEAAQSGRVSARTVYRLLEDSGFRADVTRLRAEMVERAVAQLAESSVVAVATLRSLLDMGPFTVRLGAARAILELGVKLRESVELEARVSALEMRGNGKD